MKVDLLEVLGGLGSLSIGAQHTERGVMVLEEVRLLGYLGHVHLVLGQLGPLLVGQLTHKARLDIMWCGCVVVSACRVCKADMKDGLMLTTDTSVL